MIDRSHALPLARQAQELGISRGSLYYLPKPVSPADLVIMRRMDELHLEFPLAGSRMLRDLLRQEGVEIGRLHVATLMKKMAIEAIYRRQTRRSRRRGIRFSPICCASWRSYDRTRSGQPISRRFRWRRGFVYLAAIVDWFSRNVLAWRVSITIESDFCVEALEEALARFGKMDSSVMMIADWF